MSEWLQPLVQATIENLAVYVPTMYHMYGGTLLYTSVYRHRDERPRDNQRMVFDSVLCQWIYEKWAMKNGLWASWQSG